jgi:Sulfotransferase family
VRLAVVDRIGDVDARQMAAWQREIVRERNTLRLLRAPLGDTGWPALDGYSKVTGLLYAALFEVTGARVIVDSSKRPSYAAALRHAVTPPPRYLHLVRDPRASAYSWRHRRHESVHGEGREVTRRNVFDSTTRWTLLNLGAEAVGREVAREGMMRLRFEDFLAAPEHAVARVSSFLGEQPAETPFLDHRTVRLGMNHTLAGNPARFSTGIVSVGSDEEWRDRQSVGEQLAATILSLPFLSRYGYPLRPGARG